MKLKSKILMAVLAMFFLVAGNAFATPIDVSYTVSGEASNYILTFNIDESFDVNSDQKVYFFGVDVGTSVGFPAGWKVWINGDVKNNSSLGGNNINYTTNWIINPANALEGDVTGFQISVNTIPTVINYFVFTSGTVAYNGDFNKEVGTNPGFQGIDDPASVPEPATLLLLGFGLVGLAGLRRKR